METKVLAVAAGHEITEDEVNQFINNMPQEQRAYMSLSLIHIYDNLPLYCFADHFHLIYTLFLLYK